MHHNDLGKVLLVQFQCHFLTNVQLLSKERRGMFAGGIEVSNRVPIGPLIYQSSK